MPLRIPHASLTDAQWSALLPLLARSDTRGRPIRDPRGRMDAIFRLAATDDPWRLLPPGHGPAATVARYFRRLTHGGFWERLLIALAAAPKSHPLREIEGLICRAASRAMRIRGLGLNVLARRLNLKRALPGPPWMVANPILSETLFAMKIPVRFPLLERNRAYVVRWCLGMRRLLTTAAGRRYIPSALKACWR
ncbi:transposase [Roseococcus sp. YIM B11640]|uniref:transposase n=1 Tax=Roseococcus sp. YIM B11640 TaxID=3133973 RepID=UPI003C7D65A0